MSYKLYAFSASSDDNLQQQIGAMKSILLNNPMGNSYEIDLQIFRTSKGIHYRVLEPGYGLQNIMWGQPQMFPQVNYDTRSDVPDEDIGNKEIADEIDHLIMTKQWHIITLTPPPTPSPQAQ